MVLLLKVLHIATSLEVCLVAHHDLLDLVEICELEYLFTRHCGLWYWRRGALRSNLRCLRDFFLFVAWLNWGDWLLLRFFGELLWWFGISCRLGLSFFRRWWWSEGLGELVDLGYPIVVVVVKDHSFLLSQAFEHVSQELVIRLLLKVEAATVLHVFQELGRAPDTKILKGSRDLGLLDPSILLAPSEGREILPR